MDVLAAYGSDSENDDVETKSEEPSHLSGNISVQDLKSKYQLQIAPVVEDKKVIYISLKMICVKKNSAEHIFDFVHMFLRKLITS